ncbi:MAG: hypothetical protein Q4E35_05625 [Eubacteriales bacterium]|nr:hypothetical protein [Eubacteriales bacterium]
MKIQNTEMEFVAFDAQDVIATSGTPLGYFSTAILDAEGWTLASSVNSSFGHRISDFGDLTYWIDYDGGYTLPSVYGGAYKFYVINSAVSYTYGDDSSNIYFDLDADGMDDAPTGAGYKNLADYNEICSWLIGIATPQ